MMQLLENGKNRNIGPSFYPPKFLPWVLPLLVVNVPSYHPMQFPEKLMDQTLRK